jgi:hypothetical protein
MSFRTAYGYTYSENGWRMCNRDECAIVQIPDLYLVNTAPLRTGAPLTILGAWLRWYDQNVEEIGSAVWGWSADNDVPNSNHLSGTAVDVNAPRYPWGARVMPAGKIAKVREGLRLFEGTVFWGADWDRADEMHYQMAFREGDPRNEAFAAKLRAGHLGIYSTPKPTPKEPVVAALSDAEWREMLDNTRKILAQVGPKLPSWGDRSSFGKDASGNELTQRDGLIAKLNAIAAKVGVK